MSFDYLANRRNFLTTSLGTIGALCLPGLPAFAAGRTLTCNTVGFSLGIHIPSQFAMNEGMAAVSKDASTCEAIRIDKLPVITQNLLSGASQIADSDIVSTLKAVKAGADLKVIGLTYNNSSLVFVANGDIITSIADLAKPDVVVAVNSKSDFTAIMLAGPLSDAGLTMDDIELVEIGGSGNRVKALLSGRVHAIPAHIDQVQSIQSQGNYTTLVEPWKAYKSWYGEVLCASGAWLADSDNRAAAVACIQAHVEAFRKANTDFAWYAEQFRKYSTIKDTASATDDQIRAAWEPLKDIVNAWPNDMETLSAEAFGALNDPYVKAGVLDAPIDMSTVVDRTILDEALANLSRG